MAKRKAGSARASAKAKRRTVRASRRRSTGTRRHKRVAARSAKRPTAKAKRSSTPSARRKARKAPKSLRAVMPAKLPRLDRARRTLNDDVVPTPPSSLNMDRKGSAARTGRAEYAETLRDHRGMMDVAAGDVDVDVEDAFFTGEEAPGGDNPTPDQDVVDDIGKALGVEYADNEELKAADKVGKRDKHRWELDPASAEDYKDRD